MPKQLYLNIANFHICLQLNKEELLYYRRSLIRILLSAYGAFFISKHQRIDFTIVFQETKILALYKKKKHNRTIVFSKFVAYDWKKNTAYTHYFISQMQFEQILKIILAQHLLLGKGIFIHGSASLFQKKVLLFFGDSGAGKSTIVRFLSSFCPVVADDQFIVRVIKKQLIFYQTPFYDKNWKFQRSPEGHRISHIFFLKKSKKNSVRRILQKQDLKHLLLKQFILPTQKLEQFHLEILKYFISQPHHYLLHFMKSAKRVSILIKNLLPNAEKYESRKIKVMHEM